MAETDDEEVFITTQEVTVVRTEYISTRSGCSTPRRQIRARSSSYSEKGSNYNYNYTFATVNSSYSGEPDFNQSEHSTTGNLGGQFFNHHSGAHTNAEGDAQPTDTSGTNDNSEGNKRSSSCCGKAVFRKTHQRCSPKRSASGTSLDSVQKYYRRPIKEKTTTNIREYPIDAGCDEFLVPPNRRTGLKRVLSFSSIEDRNPEVWDSQDSYHDDGSPIFFGSYNQESTSDVCVQEQPDDLRSHHLSRRESFDVLCRIKSYMSQSTDHLSVDTSSTSDETHSVISSDDSDVVMLIYSRVPEETLPTAGLDGPGTSTREDRRDPCPLTNASEYHEQGRQVIGVCSLKQTNQNQNIYEQQERLHQQFLAAQAGGSVDPELLIFNIEAIPDRGCANPRKMVLPPLRRYSTSNDSLPLIPPFPKIVRSVLSEPRRPIPYPPVWELTNDVPPKHESTGSNFDFAFEVKPINDDTYVPLCTQNRVVLHPITCIGKKFQPPQVDRDADLNVKGSRSEPSLSLLWNPEEMLWDFKYLQYLETPKQFLDPVTLRTFLIYRPDAIILSKKYSDVDIEIIAVTVNKYKIGYYRAYRLRSFHMEPLGSVPDDFPVDLILLKSIVADDPTPDWRIVNRDLVIAIAIILNEYEDLIPKIIFLLLSDRLFITSNSLLCYFKHEYENVCDLLFSMRLNAWNAQTAEYMDVDPIDPCKVKHTQPIDFKRKHKAYIKQLKPPCKLTPLPPRPRVKTTQKRKIPNYERYPPPSNEELEYLQRCSEMRARPRIVSCRRKDSPMQEDGLLDCEDD